jgi:hypothetical protein
LLTQSVMSVTFIVGTDTQFIYSNRNVYIAIALCSKLLHSEIPI